MKIPAAKIEMAVSQEESRYTLQAVKLDVEEKAMIATDGHILAYVPVETHAEDHSALISLEAMKRIRAIQKQNKIGRSEIPVKVQTNGKITVESIDSKSEFPLTEGSFPNWQLVKPQMSGLPTIAIDAALLLKLAQALSGENTPKKAVVKLWIKDGASAIGVRVSGAGDSEAWGVIMPVRV